MFIHCKGFTLVELLAVLFIAGTFAAAAIPVLSQTVHQWRLRNAVQDLYQGFQMAKNSAARGNTLAGLVFDRDSGGSISGFTVFSDLDADLSRDEGEPILEQVRWRDYPGISLAREKGGVERISFDCNAGSHPAVGFRPNGIPVSSTGGLGMGSVFLENRCGRSLGVILSCAGRLRIAETPEE
ncbi:pilus assembly FimT family protein [Desulfatiglans anilini]|uniref:pilus assembly FimT family protein n=1 Tax=Desulfatiglans anilini TaxID=90728 RepID=UPI000414CFD4|nr:GspH/FimT family pseudopilin [Desulfatiglans anilini]